MYVGCRPSPILSECYNNFESCLVVEVKSKHYIDPLLMELKELVRGKLNDSFSQGGDCVLRYQGRLCIPTMDDLRKQNF